MATEFPSVRKFAQAGSLKQFESAGRADSHDSTHNSDSNGRRSLDASLEDSADTSGGQERVTSPLEQPTSIPRNSSKVKVTRGLRTFGSSFGSTTARRESRESRDFFSFASADTGALPRQLSAFLSADYPDLQKSHSA